jgi:hypothetical protein
MAAVRCTVNSAALICERPALCRQTNRTVAITPPPAMTAAQGRPLDEVRATRDQIADLVRQLVDELDHPALTAAGDLLGAQQTQTRAPGPQ